MTFISINFTGGLGNQLFYIAAGKYYAEKYNKILILPNKKLTGTKIHEESILHTIFKENFHLIPEKYISKKCDKIIEDKNIDNYNINEDDNIMLTGMFQNIKYAEYSREYIYNIISKTKYYKKALLYLDLIKNYFNDKDINNYVMIHIRRNDFLEDYSPTNLLYYDQAYKLFYNDKIKIIIFSDDIEWCKNNLKFHNMYFVDNINEYINPNENTYISLCLMTMFNNAILNESTFGWWSAILGNIDKKIIVPKNRKTIQFENLEDIYPNNWIKLNCDCHI
jgi:hypothetical protein